MADGRHRQAKHRKPRQLPVPRAAKIAIPGAAVALLASASAAVWPTEAPQQQATPTAAADLSKRTERPDRSSRTPRSDRQQPSSTPKPKPTPTSSTEATSESSSKPLIEGSKYVTTELNVWPEPDEGGDLLTVLDTGDKVNVTGEVDGDWAEILRDGQSRWVRSDYLSADKPKEEETSDEGEGGVSTKECTNGAEINSGVTEDAQRVFRAVCAKFPSITQYLTTESGSGEHGSGRAVDIMVDDSSLGMQIRDYLKANAGALGVSELIYRQQIWTVQRSGEGWRSMEDRGSPSANHMDHVHATVYGSSGTA